MGINFQHFHNIYFQTYASAVDFQSPQVWESFCELLHYMLVNLHWRLTNASSTFKSQIKLTVTRSKLSKVMSVRQVDTNLIANETIDSA